MTDIDGLCFVRTERGLSPADIHADEWLGTLPFKREVIVSVRRPRNPKHHRWFFALLKKVIDNTDDMWSSIEHLLEALKMAAGHFNLRQDLTGEYYRVPKSINFSSMGQDDFQIFVYACIDQIARHTGLDPTALMAEVDAEQGGSPFKKES